MNGFLFRVVKEEIVDDEMVLPSVNGRIVTWVSLMGSLYFCLIFTLLTVFSRI